MIKGFKLIIGKQGRILLLLFICAVFSFSTCSKETTGVDITGKLVHRSCATVAIEVMDPAYYNIGQDVWVQDSSKPARYHVFAVTNSCEFPTMDTGTIFKFRLLDKGREDCIVCMLWDNPPTVKRAIKVIDN